MKRNNVKGGIPNIVIPTIRSEEFFEKFLDSWKEEFRGCHVIVVEDREKKSLTKLLKLYEGIFTYDIYDWRDIDKDLGKDAWIIPRQTDCVRSYGYLKAYQNKPSFIVTLDDDVTPCYNNVIMEHWSNLNKKVRTNYINTLNPLEVRGSEVFNHNAEVVVSHGTWVNTPDLSGKKQVEAVLNNKFNNYSEKDFYQGPVPRGVYTSTCGMNLAWKPEVTKHMYFGLQGKDKYGIDRCGDIWCGFWLTNNLEDGQAIYTGNPAVIHTRASNVWNNIKKEQGSSIYGKEFILFSKGNFDMIMEEPSEGYWELLKKAYVIWMRYFE